MILFVKVSPNARQNSIESYQDNVLKVRIKAPPDKGKANQGLINFLAESLNIPKNCIRLVSGASSRMKKIEIEGDPVQLVAKITEMLT
jgi:hypothetical protein